MNAAQVALVQSSFCLILPEIEPLISRFYARLFALDPALRRLFAIDMDEQSRKLITMLVVVVRGLSCVERMLPEIQDLGRRHVRYGVEPQDYATAKVALMWALQQSLGPHWTSEVADAWAVAYTLLDEAMQATDGDVTDAAGAQVHL